MCIRFYHTSYISIENKGILCNVKVYMHTFCQTDCVWQHIIPSKHDFLYCYITQKYIIDYFCLLLSLPLSTLPFPSPFILHSFFYSLTSSILYSLPSLPFLFLLDNRARLKLCRPQYSLIGAAVATAIVTDCVSVVVCLAEKQDLLFLFSLLVFLLWWSLLILLLLSLLW